jgi:hypothetical protein
MKNKSILFPILFTALLVRVLFYLFGAQLYYGTPNFVVQGDTMTWADSILNLIYNHSYSADLTHSNGWFYRPPGYSFFIGIIYILTGSSLENTFAVIPWVQIILDTCTVYFIHKTASGIFSDTKAANIAALLYTFYPYSIVWTPVAYAETLSLFLLALSMYLLVNKRSNLIYSGVFAGMAVLTRPQIIFIVPFILVALINVYNLRSFKLVFYFLTGFTISYGLWPARNFILHDRLVLSQDMRIGKNWSEDFLSFAGFVYSVQTDHKPQFDQIVYNQEVKWPKEAYIHTGDSAVLDSAVKLCRECGTGFSYFMHYRNPEKQIVDKNNCDSLIASKFIYLIEEQKQHNPVNYYVIVPLGNLYKCIFKNNLYGNKTPLVKTIAFILLLWRTLLILAGIAASIYMYRNGIKERYILIIAGFFTAWYLYICFFYRNIEIRYLLQCDVLMLIPVCWLISRLTQKKSKDLQQN